MTKKTPFEQSHGFNLRDSVTLLVVAGSRAFGLNTPESDVDLRGVCVPPLRVKLFNRFEEADAPVHFEPGNGIFEMLPEGDLRAAGIATKTEGCITESQKFLQMLQGNNPTTLEMVFVRDEDVLFTGRIGQWFRDNAQRFLSQKIRHSTTGYAHQQLTKIKNHMKWINGKFDEPSRADFDLPDSEPAFLGPLEAIVKLYESKWHTDLSAIDNTAVRDWVNQKFTDTLSDVLKGFVEADGTFVGKPHRRDHLLRFAATRRIGVDDNMMEVLANERRYRAAREEWDNYQKYLKTRNKDRLALESVHGYDTKHAAHLVRLLRLGYEAMTTGKFQVYRDDAEELRSIRAGAWTFDRLIEEAEALEKQIATIPKEKIVLPYAPDPALKQEFEELLYSVYQQPGVLV